MKLFRTKALGRCRVFDLESQGKRASSCCIPTVRRSQRGWIKEFVEGTGDQVGCPRIAGILTILKARFDKVQRL